MDGPDVFLKDIWPSAHEVQSVIDANVTAGPCSSPAHESRYFGGR